MAKKVYYVPRKLSLKELLEKGDEVMLQQRAEAGKKLSNIFQAAKKYGLDKQATSEE